MTTASVPAENSKIHWQSQGIPNRQFSSETARGTSLLRSITASSQSGTLCERSLYLALTDPLQRTLLHRASCSHCRAADTALLLLLVVVVGQTSAPSPPVGVPGRKSRWWDRCMGDICNGQYTSACRMQAKKTSRRRGSRYSYTGSTPLTASLGSECLVPGDSPGLSPYLTPAKLNWQPLMTLEHDPASTVRSASCIDESSCLCLSGGFMNAATVAVKLLNRLGTPVIPLPKWI